jgi:hypothetical protein
LFVARTHARTHARACRYVDLVTASNGSLRYWYLGPRVENVDDSDGGHGHFGNSSSSNNSSNLHTGSSSSLYSSSRRRSGKGFTGEDGEELPTLAEVVKQFFRFFLLNYQLIPVSL